MNASMYYYFIPSSYERDFMYYMYSQELHWHQCALLYAIIALLVITLVKRYSHIVEHHPFTAAFFS